MRANAQSSQESNGEEHDPEVSVSHQDTNLSVPSIVTIFHVSVVARDHTLSSHDHVHESERSRNSKQGRKVAKILPLCKRNGTVNVKSNEHEESPSVNKLQTRRSNSSCLLSSIFLAPSLHILRVVCSTKEDEPTWELLLLSVTIPSVPIICSKVVLAFATGPVDPTAFFVVVIVISIVIVVVLLLLSFIILSLLLLEFQSISIGIVVFTSLRAPGDDGDENGKEPRNNPGQGPGILEVDKQSFRVAYV